MPPLVQFGSSVNIDVVSIHPRLFRRGNLRGGSVVTSYRSFQSTPAFSGEGTVRFGRTRCTLACFNPPPPFQARERKSHRGHGRRAAVSIHPRLFRRGNSTLSKNLDSSECFNPPPPFQAREQDQRARFFLSLMFQSTPAFSGEGTAQFAA